MKLGTVRALLGTTLAVVLSSLVVLAVFWGTQAQWEQGRVSTAACNDYWPCTSNRVLPDGSCVTPSRVLANGTDCWAEDRCYTAYRRDAPTVRVSKHCSSDGACLARRADCRGYCTTDEDCEALPLRLSALLGAEVSLQCSLQSCVTLVTGGQTSECLSWLDTTGEDMNTSASDEQRYLERCLYTSYTVDVCLFRYRCAPYVTVAPTGAPTPPTVAPTKTPTSAPTNAPTNVPTVAPTTAPSAAPTTKAPTKAPTTAPTTAPTVTPTTAPTSAPTPEPTQETEEPTPEPTQEP